MSTGWWSGPEAGWGPRRRARLEDDVPAANVPALLIAAEAVLSGRAFVRYPTFV